MRSVFFNKSGETMNNSNVGFDGAAYRITVTRNQVKKSKRIRSAFTTDQVQSLEEEYKKHPYIESLRRKEVAKNLNITERSVKIWFQNRRMREKHDNKELDFNTVKNSTISRLSNSPTSTNGSSLPQIMTSDDKSNESNIDKDIIVKSESLNTTNLDGCKGYFKAKPSKSFVYSPSQTCNVPGASQKTAISSNQTHAKPLILNKFYVPKTGCANRFYHPGYVRSTAIWRPVDMVPMVSKKPASVLNTVQRTRQSSGTCCKCNCHRKRNSGMVKMVPQPNPIYPYPPFMFTAVPFQNPL